MADELAVRIAATLSAGAVLWIGGQLAPGIGGIVAVPAAYLLTELVCRQALLAMRAKRSLKRLLAGNFARQGLLFAAQLSVSALTVLTYRSMGSWSLIPVVGLLLLMRQAYAMLLEIRETYLNTVSVLIEAAESQNPVMVGHSERTAAVARSIGAQYGLGTSEIERLSYGALLHDIGKIADAPTDQIVTGSSAAIVSDAAFFEHVVPILEVLDERPSASQSHPRDSTWWPASSLRCLPTSTRRVKTPHRMTLWRRSCPPECRRRPRPM